MVVVSLAPEQAAVPAEVVSAAGLEAPTAEASVEEPAAYAGSAAVELTSVAVDNAPLAEPETFPAGPLATSDATPALSRDPLTWLPTVNGVIATGTTVEGARASPRERDGHRVAATKAEEQKAPAAGVSAPGPLEDQGPGASGGSAGGGATGAASSRYFAIATTPLRFDFPSTFAHAPLPSSVPQGALEDAPTTRPG